MYLPTDWLTVSNSTIPEIAADFAAEAQASSAKVNKRDASDTTSYSVTALICSDGIEVNTTMEEVFEGIISSSRNVSHMCMSLNLLNVLRALKLIIEIQSARHGRSRRTTAHSGLLAR